MSEIEMAEAGSDGATAIRTMIVDDHPLVIEGLQSCLESFPRVELVAVASNAADAIETVVEERPAIVLMDINMPGMNGLDAIEIIAERCPETRILILSMHDNREYVSAALNYGAKGYLLKDAPSSEIVAAIEAVAAGESYFSEGVPEAQAPAPSGAESVLTTREQSVLQRLAEGLSNKEVAAELGISVRTVETHRKNIKRKTDVSSTAGLTRFAIENGLLKLGSGRGA